MAGRRVHRRWAALLLAVLAPLAFAAGDPGAVEAVDDLGRHVRLAAPARRIVSLSPHATELLFEVGAGARLAAVERNSDHPPAARALPTVSALPRPDPERILAFSPDLVILWGPAGARDLVARLEALGIAVFVSDPRSFDAIAVAAERLGLLAGAGPRAVAAADALRARIAALRSRYAGRRPVPVFVQVWNRPLMTLSDRDLIGDALAACGARNVFGGLAQAAAEVDPESVLRRAPRLILAFDGDPGRRLWDGLGALPPRGATGYVQADRTLQRPTPRAVDALEAVCAEIDRFR